MSDENDPSDNPFPGNPFQGMPFLGDLAKMLQGQGPVNWDAARQFAVMIATEGKAENNVDPMERMQFQELARIADLHVQTATGLETLVNGRAVEITPVTPGTWAQRSIDAYRPLFEKLAGAIGPSATPPPSAEELAVADPAMAMFAPLMAMLSPMMLGMSAGSMVGHLSRRSFGQYDLPIPRPANHEILVVSDTISAFGHDWSLPADDLRLWVCVQEITSHAVLAVPHLRAELERLLGAYVAAFRPNPDALADQMGSLDMSGAGGMDEMQQVFSNPEVLLGAMGSPEQSALRPQLDALVAVVVGYVDHTLDHIAKGLVGSSSMIAEAVRRRRVEADQSDVFVEKLLGLTLTQSQVERGHAFVEGVRERDGDIARLWTAERNLPTPNEVDAPGLWLARIDID